MKKLTTKPIVPSKFLGFLTWILLFMVTSNMITWSFNDPTFILFLMILLGGLLLLLGINKTSIFGEMIEILKVLGDENLTVGQRIALAREIINKSVGLMADLSNLEKIERKKEEDVPKIPELD